MTSIGYEDYIEDVKPEEQEWIKKVGGEIHRMTMARCSGNVKLYSI